MTEQVDEVAALLDTLQLVSDVEKLEPETSIVAPTDPEELLNVMLGDDPTPIVKLVDAESPLGLPTAVTVYEPLLAEATVNVPVIIPPDMEQV